MKKIQQHMKEFMSKEDMNIVTSGRFSVRDFNRLNKVLNGTDEDFIIFDNKGGKKFDIMFNTTEPDSNIADLVKYLLNNHKNLIFSYQLNGEEVILNNIF